MLETTAAAQSNQLNISLLLRPIFHNLRFPFRKHFCLFDMLLSFGGNEDGQCGRHDFKSEDEEEGHGSELTVRLSDASKCCRI